jgi:hypothetical protein
VATLKAVDGYKITVQCSRTRGIALKNAPQMMILIGNGILMKWSSVSIYNQRHSEILLLMTTYHSILHSFISRLLPKFSGTFFGKLLASV